VVLSDRAKPWINPIHFCDIAKRNAYPGKDFFAPLQSAPRLYYRRLGHWFAPCPKYVCTISVTMEAPLPQANFEGFQVRDRTSSSDLLPGVAF
jgi:hypothetical protein